MIKRPFFALLGLGAGLAIGVWSVRQLDAARARLQPDALVETAAERASGFRRRLALAAEQGRASAAAREAELRGVYRVGNAAPAERR